MSRDRNPRGGQWLAQGEDVVAGAADDERERQRDRVGEHRCHAIGCDTSVLPALLMCRAHWMMVPKPLRKLVWSLYRSGQEVRKDPSREYLEAAKAAIAAVAVREGRQMELAL